MITTRTASSPKGEITIYKLTNTQGSSVELSTLGAGIISIVVPDAKGKMTDVALGYGNPADYLYDGPCMGKVPGRFANRIAHGKFTLEGKDYTLPINNGPNSLHGGPEGFQNQIWKATSQESEGASSVIFSLYSADGEMGYPGNLIAKVYYSWQDNNSLSITFFTFADQPSIANLTNHTYFNLNGEDSGSVLDHTLWLKYHHYLPTDDTLIPTGEVVSVVDTPMDFSSQVKTLGRDILSDFPAINYGKGYDNCWVTPEKVQDLDMVARLYSAASGITLEVETDYPGVQIYTGNWLEGSPLSKSSRGYNDYDGVAIECQYWPDSPNHPEWGHKGYNVSDEALRWHHIVFNFSVE